MPIKEVVSKLGNPKVILRQAPRNLYLYDLPYGTLAIFFTSEFTETPVVATVYMSLAKPDKLTLESF